MKKTILKYKLIIFAAFFSSCGVLLTEGFAQAFSITNTYQFNLADRTYTYLYNITLAPGESFASGNQFTLTNLVGVTGATPASSFTNSIVSSNQVVWNAITNSGSTTNSYTFFIDSPAPPGVVNWSFNAKVSPSSGTITGPVPEPITTLLGSSFALGFGVLLKQQYSRKQKQLKNKVII